jgi:hypothetical protein
MLQQDIMRQCMVRIHTHDIQQFEFKLSTKNENEKAFARTLPFMKTPKAIVILLPSVHSPFQTPMNAENRTERFCVFGFWAQLETQTALHEHGLNSC